jgi:hypothetical protein
MIYICWILHGLEYNNFVHLTLTVHELRHTILRCFCIHVDLANNNSSKYYRVSHVGIIIKHSTEEK